MSTDVKEIKTAHDTHVDDRLYLHTDQGNDYNSRIYYDDNPAASFKDDDK